MKDTIPKGTGTSRKLKAPSTMPPTFEAWRSQLLAGTATMDISLNPAGCDVVGMPLSKATLLPDSFANLLALSGDPTPADSLAAMYAITKSLSDRLAELEKRRITVSVSDSGGYIGLMLNSAGSLTVAGKSVTAAAATDVVTDRDVSVAYTLKSTLSDSRSVVVDGKDIGTVKTAGDRVSTTVPVWDGKEITVYFAGATTLTLMEDDTV